MSQWPASAVGGGWIVARLGVVVPDQPRGAGLEEALPTIATLHKLRARAGECIVALAAVGCADGGWRAPHRRLAPSTALAAAHGRGCWGLLLPLGRWTGCSLGSAAIPSAGGTIATASSCDGDVSTVPELQRIK